MADKAVGSYTDKTTIALTDEFLIAESGGAVKNVTMPFVKDANGKINLGTSNPKTKLDIENAAKSETNKMFYLKQNGSDSGLIFIMDDLTTSKIFLTSVAAGTETDYITLDRYNGRLGIIQPSPAHTIDVVGTAGLSTGTTWTNTCDKRTKTHIEDANIDICYDNVKNLKLSYMELSENYYGEENKDRHKVGWIADDVEKVFVKAVNTQELKDISDCKNLNIDPIISAMYGAIQKLQQIVEAQEIRIKALENG